MESDADIEELLVFGAASLITSFGSDMIRLLKSQYYYLNYYG